MRMTAYGRKQTFGLSLNACFLTAALEKKADVQVTQGPHGVTIPSQFRGDSDPNVRFRKRMIFRA